MNWYDKIKRYYDGGYYTVDQVRSFVKVGKITEEEFTEITGQEY